MPETVAKVNIGEFLAHKIDRTIQSKSTKSRENFVKKAILHYLEDLSIYNLKSDLFKETLDTKKIMFDAWEKPMKASEALKILSSLGSENTKESIDKSIQITENEVESKYAKAYKELQETA
ncbi:MAG: hypothetical protein HF975_15790 [ANME-2 cluster archaeon]|nr:hypothetical protein [ANME-2 cluster archaeon]MBC2748426.1 hypothetical protein [ANME-2 cluster archaeon]